MSAKIQSIVESMKANLHWKLKLDEMAQSVGLSRSRICYLFKSRFGMSPGQYLKMLRMQKARELLEKTSLSVKAIMVNVGIQDKDHFTQDFKKVYGVTASQYRKRISGGKLSENSAGEVKQ